MLRLIKVSTYRIEEIVVFYERSIDKLLLFEERAIVADVTVTKLYMQTVSWLSIHTHAFLDRNDYNAKRVAYKQVSTKTCVLALEYNL